MKKTLLIPSLLTIGVTPIVSLVGCKDKDPEPEPEYIEIYLNWYDYYVIHRSSKIDLEAGKSYKFIIASIYAEEDNFFFADKIHDQKYDVNVQLHKVVVNDVELTESVDYKIRTSRWGITSWHHDAGRAEIYLTANETMNDIYAWTLG